MPLPLHFHLTIILALQILLTPPRFREKLGLRGISRKLPLWNEPARIFVGSGERVFLLLFIIVFYCPNAVVCLAPLSNFIPNCNKYYFARRV